MQSLVNSGLSQGTFPKELKAGDITSLFKMEDAFTKKNYRPINIYLNDLFMFLEETEICIYANDTNIYACDPNIENVIMHLEMDALKITKGFPNNYIELNEDKCHSMIFGAKRSNETTIKIREGCVNDSTKDNLLAIAFDQSLSFKQHVKAFCTKASQKLLARILRYMDTEKIQRLMKAFVLLHFSYFPPVRMFYDRTLVNGINHIHKMEMRFAYKDCEKILVFSWSNINRCQCM